MDNVHLRCDRRRSGAGWHNRYVFSQLFLGVVETHGDAVPSYFDTAYCANEVHAMRWPNDGFFNMSFLKAYRVAASIYPTDLFLTMLT